jgi:catechol-2,3-dioxygenase
LADFADERKRLETLGLRVETTEHAWVHWRSLYVTDPEGNQVELVCYDNPQDIFPYTIPFTGSPLGA